MLARLIGGIATQEKLRPLDRGGVTRAVEHAARLADDANKLTLLVERMHDLIAEASHLAGAGGRDIVTGADVGQAITQQIQRASRLRERSQEMILRDIALIETSGARIGQVNGLSVLSLGDYAFGRPSRISSRVRPGAGKSSISNARWNWADRSTRRAYSFSQATLPVATRWARPCRSTPASCSNSRTAVLREIAPHQPNCMRCFRRLPSTVRQDLAVTGSVNQHGFVQAIGGVNEKIEGFFDVCVARGLTGSQGVLIPQANVQHLMLREDVVQACAAGRFAVYPLLTIDQGIALLTGHLAGERESDGSYPVGSVNRLVEDRLKQFARVRKEAGTGTSEADMT